MTSSESFIVDFINHFGLPLRVKSTAIQIFHIISLESSRNLCRHTLDSVNSVYFSIFLALKCEDIQDFQLKYYDRFCNFNSKETFDRELLFRNEPIIFEILGFDFLFDNVYNILFGLRVRLIERGVQLVSTFEGDVKMLDRALCCVTELSPSKFCIKELCLAVIPLELFPEEVVGIYNIELTKKIRARTYK